MRADEHTYNERKQVALPAFEEANFAALTPWPRVDAGLYDFALTQPEISALYDAVPAAAAGPANEVPNLYTAAQAVLCVLNRTACHEVLTLGQGVRD